MGIGVWELGFEAWGVGFRVRGQVVEVGGYVAELEASIGFRVSPHRVPARCRANWTQNDSQGQIETMAFR